MSYSFCDPNVTKWVYALAATDEGIMTLKGIGFSILENSTHATRVDGHDMFAVKFDHFIDAAEKKEIEYEKNLLHRKPNKVVQRTSR